MKTCSDTGLLSVYRIDLELETRESLIFSPGVEAVWPPPSSLGSLRSTATTIQTLTFADDYDEPGTVLIALYVLFDLILITVLCGTY